MSIEKIKNNADLLRKNLIFCTINLLKLWKPQKFSSASLEFLSFFLAVFGFIKVFLKKILRQIFCKLLNQKSKIILRHSKIRAKMMPKNTTKRCIIAMRRVVMLLKMKRKKRNVAIMFAWQKFWKILKMAIAVRFLTKIVRLNAKIWCTKKLQKKQKTKIFVKLFLMKQFLNDVAKISTE